MSPQSLTIVSAACFVVALFGIRKLPQSRPVRSLFSLGVLAVLALAILYFVADWFTGEGINSAVIYHLRVGLDGAGFDDFKLIISSTVAATLLALACVPLVFRVAGSAASPTPAIGYLSIFALVATLITHPALHELTRVLQPVKVPGFAGYFEQPAIHEQPQSKRNLVFIYLEGLERTFLDSAIFPGLADRLGALEARSAHFTDVQQAPGTSWTIAGMTASQCGIPLVTASNGNSMSGMDSFLRGATCLGDLLASEGYKNIYMGGAASMFAGKDKFYHSHGFQEIEGLRALYAKLPEPKRRAPWGISDEDLFLLARKRFEAQSQSGQPFALVLLTLDTHPPAGSPSPGCPQPGYQDGSNPILNAVACSDLMVSQLIQDITTGPFAENTTIVVASDHLSMRNTAWDLLEPANRRNLFFILNPAEGQSREYDAPATTLDIGPTVLHALGFKAELGLGRDLLASRPSLRSEVSDFDETLIGWTDSIMEFWEFPKLERTVQVDAGRRTLLIGERRVGFPALIEIGAEQETTFRFGFGRSGDQKELFEYAAELGPEQAFLWADECSAMQSLGGLAAEKGYCVASKQHAGAEIVFERVAGIVDFQVQREPAPDNE